MNVFLSDSTVAGSSTIGVTLGQFSSNNMNGISLANDNLQTAANAQAALADINNAISQVAALRGNIGASVNRLTAAGNVINNQVAEPDFGGKLHHFSRYSDGSRQLDQVFHPEPDRHFGPGAGEPDAAGRAQAAPVIRSFS